MDHIFLDTSFIIALEDADDENHEIAVSVWNRFKKHPKKLLTTTFVFDETVTMLKKWLGFKKAAEVGKKLLASSIAEVMHVANGDFEEAWQFFLKHDDKAFSFTDCVSFVIMRKYNIKDVLAFDKHFRQAGFRSICLDL